MARGGKRIGAGRPTGTGIFGEETKPVRVPVSKVNLVREFLLRAGDSDAMEDKTPLYGSDVQAGYPSTGDDHVETQLNLHSYVVEKPETTFFVRAKGQSMINAGIFDGDLLVVDRSIPARNGHIVIAALDGELTVKRLDKTANKLQLLPENPTYNPIEVSAEQDCLIWGVVTNVVHKV